MRVDGRTLRVGTRQQHIPTGSRHTVRVSVVSLKVGELRQQEQPADRHQNVAKQIVKDRLRRRGIRLGDY